MAVARSQFLKKKAILDLLFLILKTTTFSRICNFLLLKISYFISSRTKKIIQWGLPMSVGIEPTTACNLNCPQCISGLNAFTRPTGNLKPENFDLLLKHLPGQTWSMLFFFQGEPYINPHFLQFVRKAKQKKLFTIASTNGHFLTPEKSTDTIKAGLDYLIISIDGTTQESYQKYRKNGELNKVISGIKNIIDAKKKLRSKNPIVELQFIAFKHNEHQIPDFIKLAKKLGADKITVKSAQIYYDHEEWLPQNAPKRYKKNNDNWELIKKVPNRCWKMWHSSEITWDGKVLPCCFDKNAEHVLGNIFKTPLQSIWKEKKYRSFRKQIFTDRTQIEMCRNCSEGL